MRSDRNIENDQIKKPEGHTCKKMQKEDLLLYAVTDRHWLNGETLYSQVEKTLEGGTTFVQLREKELDEPAILLADEPTGNLDPTNSWEIMKLLEEANDRGTTVLVVTHNQEIVNEMQKRVVTMKKGVIVSDEKKGGYKHEN